MKFILTKDDPRRLYWALPNNSVKKNDFKKKTSGTQGIAKMAIRVQITTKISEDFPSDSCNFV